MSQSFRIAAFSGILLVFASLAEAQICSKLLVSSRSTSLEKLLLPPAKELRPLPLSEHRIDSRPLATLTNLPEIFKTNALVESFLLKSPDDFLRLDPEKPIVGKSFEPQRDRAETIQTTKQAFEKSINEARKYRREYRVEKSETAKPIGNHLVERAHDYLSALGIHHLLIFDFKSETLRIHIATTGPHTVNRFALNFQKLHGSVLFYDPIDNLFDGSRGSYSNQRRTLRVSDTNTLELALDEITILHELRHSRNYRDLDQKRPSPYYGSAKAAVGLLPGQATSAYYDFMSFSEMLTFSRAVKNALNQVKGALQRNKSDRDIDDIERNINRGLSVSERSFVIASMALALPKTVRPIVTEQNGVFVASVVIDTKGGFFNLNIPLVKSRSTNDPRNMDYFKEQVEFLKQAALHHWTQLDLALRVIELGSQQSSTRDLLVLLRALDNTIPSPNWSRNPRTVSIEQLVERFNANVRSEIDNPN